MSENLENIIGLEAFYCNICPNFLDHYDSYIYDGLLREKQSEIFKNQAKVQ